MKILILGMDGYLGWPLAQYMAARGHEVMGTDAFFRRKWVSEMGSQSVIPIFDMEERLTAFEKKWSYKPKFKEGDLTNWEFVAELFREFRPDCVVHLGECPSAPFSMKDRQHATMVQHNNVINTMNVIFAIQEFTPDAHLIKLGTMGEYGTPNIDIPEGFFELEFRGRTEMLPFPRSAGSWYHWSKVHGSNNIMFACKVNGLRATDVMQGVVFGTRTEEMEGDERLRTRFDIDEAFGTAINRFCAQAVIGHGITLFGKGHQRRGFIPIQDSLQCLTLAAENAPQAGEYRVFNQFEDVYDLTQLAHMVQGEARKLGLHADITHIENPRKELETHYYKPDHQKLLDLGYKPSRNIEETVASMLQDLMFHKDRIKKVSDVLLPRIKWLQETGNAGYEVAEREECVA